MFEKSLSDFALLCKELSLLYEGKNAIIEELMTTVNENLVIPMAKDP